MPRIFLFKQRTIDPDPMFDGDYIGYAIAEDGTRLASCYCAKRYQIYIRAQLMHHRSNFDVHYPKGYIVINLLEYTDEELEANTEFQAALDLGIEKYGNQE